jgi:hypothetical protein
MMAADRLGASEGGLHMTNNLISTPSDLSDLDIQQRVAPVEYKRWPARPSLDGSAWELAESPACRSRAARGALLGILLGAEFYGAVLILLRFIKL